MFEKIAYLIRQLLALFKNIRRKKKDKPIEPQKLPKPVHPWRVCPGGQHYRRTHGVSGYTTTSGKVVGPYSRDWTCVKNPSGKDQLYPEEMQEIADKYFNQFRLSPLPEIPEFYKKDLAYDHFIQGWTQYWNDVLKPIEPLDPLIIKALIVSESSFNPNAWNKKRGPGRARGLMQVTDLTLRYLALEKYHELKDHFLHLKENDMLNPNFSICAGIRWLFRKKELAQAKAKRPVSWREAIIEYKSAQSNIDLIARFDYYYNKLKIKK